MKNQFVAISDIHISLKNLEVSLQVLTQSLEKARELNVPLVIAGDLNDTKALMRSEWVEALIKLFSEDFYDVQIDIIDGNHDLNNKAGSKSSLAFLNLIKNVTVFHDPCVWGDWYFIPYCNTKEAFRRALDEAKSCSKKNLLCHQGFMGAFMGDIVVDDSSVDPKELEDFDTVLSGHYHRHQHVNNNIMYFGSPFTVSFGEVGQEKFIWQVYEVDGKISTQPHLTNIRRHKQLTLKEGFERNAFCEELRSDDLIKVIQKGTKEFALKDHSNIFKLMFPTQNVTVVPDIERQSEVRIDQDIVHEPIKVIETYLESAHTDFDKEKLKSFLWPIIADILNNLSSKVMKKSKVIRVKAENFLSYQELEYDYISKGLTLIEGHDEDFDISTGAGKSSFLDVVCYGLFGKTSKDLKADEVINRKAKKNMFVQVELDTENGTMLVNRYRKDSKYDNDLSFCYAGQSEPTRGKDNRETQKLLEAELGLDFDMFLRSSYFTQFGNIDKFLSASDTEKKKIISEICDTSVYDEMVDAVKLALKETANILDEEQKSYIAVVSKYETIKATIEDYENKSKEFEERKKGGLEALELRSKDWENQNKNQLNALLLDSKGWEDAKEDRLSNSNLESKVFEEKRKERIEKAQLDISSWDTQESLDIESIKSNIVSKTITFDEHHGKSQIPTKPDFDTSKIKVSKKLEIIKNLEKESLKISFDIDVINNKVDKYQEDIQKANEKDSEVNCLHCFQPISEQHIKNHIEELHSNIESSEYEIKKLKAKDSEIQDSLKIKSQIELDLETIKIEEMKYDSLVSNANEFGRLAWQVQDEIDSLKESLNNRPNNSFAGLIELIKKESNPHTLSIESIKKESNPHISSIEAKKTEVNPFTDKILIEQATVNPYDELAETSGEQLAEVGDQKLKACAEILRLEESIDLCLWWKDALHVYIKSYLTDSFIEQINEIANEKLAQMFDGILSINISATSENKKTTKEKITVTIYNKNEECSYNSLSGGERCRICFALNLAIRKVTDINFGFIMFDEILNGLDDVGKSQVMRVFKELELEYESVFVIDHATEFKSLFTNNIMIRKSNGISSIVE